MLRQHGIIALLASATLAIAEDASRQPTNAPSTAPILAHNVWTDIAGGRLILRAFEAAPYPHVSREAGFKSNAGVFPRDPHYADSTVAVFIPPGFVAGEQVDYVVHFHGHRNHVANVILTQNLLTQMADSRVNAILLVPQGPYLAPDSGGGKLELEDGGFQRFITQITDYLVEQKVLGRERVGHITLTAHSGGYKVTSAILHRGGMNDHITDVILFDATYGGLGWFADFMKRTPGARLVSFHTAHLDDENAELRKLLSAQATPWRDVEEPIDARAIAARGVTFVSTGLAHDAVPHQRDYFRLAIESIDPGR